MAGKKKVEKKEPTPKKTELGLRTIARVDTKVRSGCSKGNTSSCGVNYRNG